MRDHLDDVFDCLMIEIPQLNLLVKYLTLNLQVTRIDKINKLINDPIFCADGKKDEELLLTNISFMHRLSKLIIVGVSVSALFWPTSHFVRRYQDETAVVPIYVPFDTDTWGKYSISVMFEVVPLIWVGYGHIALDFVVSTYYAQAEVQMKIIKYNLEHLFDANVYTSEESFRYRDEIDEDLKKRFVYYVQRFETLAWYTKEIDEIFNPAMSFQFFTSSMSLCMVVYRLSSTPVGTVPFVFLIVLILIYSTQVFLYCYFGNLVQYESQSLLDSVYLSDWVSVSPKFRRLLLIAMQRWSRTLAPRIAGIIPLSLNTFVSILKSAYSLYAVLGTRN
ncbi:odorant receptor 88a [Anticarsia gemmatalis]|uniref:odorant receptor 88a n=1 Tax=Anticarsia gemmatalis TaxID=129554 RepID=UPI003F776907